MVTILCYILQLVTCIIQYDKNKEKALCDKKIRACSIIEEDTDLFEALDVLSSADQTREVLAQATTYLFGKNR
jgi:hypothetical protein